MEFLRNLETKRRSEAHGLREKRVWSRVRGSNSLRRISSGSFTFKLALPDFLIERTKGLARRPWLTSDVSLPADDQAKEVFHECPAFLPLVSNNSRSWKLDTGALENFLPASSHQCPTSRVLSAYG